MNQFEQLSLGLPYRKAFGRQDFLLSPCNFEAVTWIDRFPEWPTESVLIYGESGSGKTHLASIFSAYHLEAADIDMDTEIPDYVMKVVIENIETATDEIALLHALNGVMERGGYLLLTARKLPNFALPDLQSRINAMPKCHISYPDDELIYAVLVKAFYERQITVKPAVLEYAVKHMERTFAAAQKLVETADRLALAGGREITIPVVKQALEILVAERTSVA